MPHESQKCSYELEEALWRWLEGLPDEAFQRGFPPAGPLAPEDLRPAWRAVWTRKRRYLQRALEREAGRTENAAQTRR